jgi:hypothetical protein
MMKGFGLRPLLSKELYRQIEAITCAISVYIGSFSVYRRVERKGYHLREHHYAIRGPLLTTVGDIENGPKMDIHRNW